MNIYFACSITGGRQFESIYQTITKTLLEDGHIVPTAHLAGENVLKLEQTVEPREVYLRDVNWIRNCDALIAEVSTPSHGVGYEVAFALNIGKPVLCCYLTGMKVSKMITGNTNEKLMVAAYTSGDQVIKIIHNFVQKVPSL